MVPPKRNSRKEEDNSTVMLMLGLFLILLAFFILLNAISVLVDERVEQASEGVMSGFGFNPAADKTPDMAKVTIEQIHDKMAERIKKTFETYIPMKDFNLSRGAPEITIIQLSPYQFFRPGKWRLKSSQAAFFRSMSEVLAESNPGYHLEMDIRMPEMDETQKVEGDETQQDITPLVLGGYRATQFARALVERGAQAQHLTTGVTEELEHQIRIIFENKVTDKEAALRFENSRTRRR